jgi:hypothetical protein
MAGAEDDPTGPHKKNWVGLHVGLDLAFLSGTDVCEPGSEFGCFYGDGSPFTGDPAPGEGGKLNGGLALGTVRILASYERVLFGNFAVEARVGFAFNGGPKAADGTAFLPVHGEGRAKYWFGRNVLAKRGIRPYVHLGGGIAQVDAKLPVTIQAGADQPTLDAYRKLGQAFATIGGGAMYALRPQHGPILNLNLMYMLGSSGPVIEPSLGIVYGL